MTTTPPTREEVCKQLRDTQVQVVLHSRLYEAAKQLFDAACFAGDGREADRQREKMHACLDSMLDSVAGAMTLTRQLMELPG